MQLGTSEADDNDSCRLKQKKEEKKNLAITRKFFNTVIMMLPPHPDEHSHTVVDVCSEDGCN
jgi:hypothetical protein